MLTNKYFQKIFSIMLVLALCLTMMPAQSARAAGSSYYVATTGNDTDAGTIGSPFATIEHAIAIAVTGDSIYVAIGTYTNATAAPWNVTAGNQSFFFAEGVKLQPTLNQGCFNITSSLSLIHI